MKLSEITFLKNLSGDVFLFFLILIKQLDYEKRL